MCYATVYGEEEASKLSPLGDFGSFNSPRADQLAATAAAAGPVCGPAWSPPTDGSLSPLAASPLRYSLLASELGTPADPAPVTPPQFRALFGASELSPPSADAAITPSLLADELLQALGEPTLAD